ncbi:hypothetical protein Q9R46_26125 [Paenibacillus sp. RRE4]|uniref:hypothetical protein n=1 Tax=Paenibacillus sp. RRE4 TaxID=2962587 RepID=UPI002882BDF0|nr:hypothetical protein [Paenibacillus sp. RRE4]MDT0126148.1 hypothetical protein [Paenibacillus sp. RRE4]
MDLLNEEERYSKFISLIQLREIVFEGVRCERNGDFQNSNPSLDIALEYKVEDALQTELKIVFPFQFKVKAHVNQSEEELSYNMIEPENTLFNIELDMQLEYLLNIDEVDTTMVTEDYASVLEIFAERNVTLNAWPYVREIIHDLTMKMGLSALVIPLKKFPSL